MKFKTLIVVATLLLTACSSSEKIDITTVESQESTTAKVITINPEKITVVGTTEEVVTTEVEPSDSVTSEEVTPPTVEPATEPPIIRPVLGYNDVSQQAKDIIRTMLYSKAEQQDPATIQYYLDSLRTIDPAEANAWGNVISYWDLLYTPDFINPNLLPEGLPQDNSLCLVVMGFELKPDGSMRDELIGRIATALNCANQYPNAYVLVTGGGTAEQNPAATEADQMAQWLLENGLSPDRLIVENQSKTSADNALFSYRILKERYPEVKQVALVTSDYHITTSCLLFYTQFAFSSFVNGDVPLNVCSNAAYMSGSTAFFSLRGQANWMLNLFSIQ